MRDQAGHLRRRRMLLLAPHLRKPETPVLAAEPGTESVPPVSADDDYMAACGADVRYSLSVEDLTRRVLREQPLEWPIFQIGKGPENDLWLKHDRIRSRHLLLVRLPEGIYFVALSPKAEVLGPKGPMTSGWWTAGLILRVGAFRLRMVGPRRPVPSENPLVTSPEWEAELPRLVLSAPASPTTKRSWRLTRRLTLIGRSPACKIRLEHEGALPVEAAIVRTTGRLWLINLSDPARVLVNDAPILSTALDVGDRVAVGDFRVVVEAKKGAPETRSPSSTIVRTPAESSRAEELDHLVHECAAQYQKILESQQKALDDLERLAGQALDPARLKSVLDRIRQSYESLGHDQAQLQERLQRTPRPDA